MTERMQDLLQLAHQAGDAIMAIYAEPFSVTSKNDDSPLTAADLAAHQCLVAGLARIAPDIPCLSEESAPADIEQRAHWQRFWLIDPLDGTKEFVKRNGEFTVNIALIEEGQPVLGIVHAPALNCSYWGARGEGAWRQIGGGSPEPVRVSPVPAAGSVWRVVGSRSHQSLEFGAFMAALTKETEVLSMGSSLKFCLVAEGRADLYPRLGPTAEWDTAAAQAVVEAAGGQVLALPSLQPLRYNMHADTLLNPWFVVCAGVDEAWREALLSAQRGL